MGKCKTFFGLVFRKSLIYCIIYRKTDGLEVDYNGVFGLSAPQPLALISDPLPPGLQKF